MYFVCEDVRVYMCSCVSLCIPEALSFTTWVLESKPLLAEPSASGFSLNSTWHLHFV